MDEEATEIVRIDFTRLRKTAMLLATCHAFRTLLVHGRNVDEMQTRIVSAIMEHFENAGAADIRVRKLKGAGTDDGLSLFETARYEVRYRRRVALH